VSDVVDANLRAMSGPSGVVANLGWGREVTDLEVFETVAAATGYRKPPVYVPARPGEVERVSLDATLARQTWGWCPTVTLREGVDRVVVHVRSLK
jgi:UDP-glucose 4-epimerase